MGGLGSVGNAVCPAEIILLDVTQIPNRRLDALKIYRRAGGANNTTGNCLGKVGMVNNAGARP
jgi:hypothetical protein